MASQSQSLLSYMRDGSNFKRRLEYSDEAASDEECDDMEESEQLIRENNLSRFLGAQQLLKCTTDDLAHVLQTNLASFFYSKIKYLAKLLRLDSEYSNDHVEAKLTMLITWIDGVYDHLTAMSAPIKLDMFAAFFVATLRSSGEVFDYLKIFITNDSAAAVNTQSQQVLSSSQALFSNLTQFQSELNKKINAILLKLSNLLEAKVSGFNEAHNRNCLMQISYYTARLISDYTTEYKSGVFLWKVLSKIVCKQCVYAEARQSSESQIVIQTGKCQVSQRETFYTFFLTIHESLFSNLKTLRQALAKFIPDSQVDLLNSQSKSTSAAKDVLKRIKYCSFLFKIFKSSVSTYQQEWLNFDEAYFLITNIFGLIGYILLQEVQVNIEGLMEGQVENEMKEFYSLKTEFVKEFAANYEHLLGFFSQNYKYHLYLTRFSIFQKLSISQLIEPANHYKFNGYLSSFYEESGRVEEILVFYAIFVNKFYATNNVDKTLDYLNLTQITDKGRCDEQPNSMLNGLPFLDVILDTTNFCLNACNGPTYFLYASK